MYDSCDDEDDKNRIGNSTKYSNFEHTLNNIKENKNKLNEIIYKDFVPKHEARDTDFVLSQINQNVDLLESSGFCKNPTKMHSLHAVKFKSNSFLSFADFKDNNFDENLENETSFENFESQWSDNTQIAEIADHIDALTSIVNLKEHGIIEDKSGNNDDDKMTISCFLDDSLNETEFKNFGDKDQSMSPIIHVSENIVANGECLEISSKLKRKLSQVQRDEDKMNVFSDELLNDENLNIFHLNETIGFTTGRNKKIKISNDALCKATTIFKDFDLNSINENMFKDDIDTDNTSSKNVAGKNENLDHFSFITGNNKMIAVSKDALKNAKSIFDNIVKEDEMKFIDTNIDKVIYNENKRVKVLTDNDLICSNSPNAFTFITGNNKKIKVSDEALSRAKSVFVGFDLNKKEDIHLKENATKSFERKLSFGFVTDNNKKITVSGDAIVKAKSPFENLDFEVKSDLTNLEEDDSFNFVTGNNRRINVSRDAFNKAKPIFTDLNLEEVDIDISKKISDTNKENEDIITKNLTDIENVQISFGFVTGNNRKIAVSENALKKAKAMFTDVDCGTAIEKIETSFGYNTDSYKKNTVSENALSKAKSVFADIDSRTMTEKVEPSFGFTTGNNRKITVSEDALNKAKAMFTDVDCGTAIEKIEPSFGFTTGNNRKITVSEDALNKAKAMFTDGDCGTTIEKIEPSFGFTTGNNRKITVSEDALNKAKVMFTDIDFKTAIDNKIETSSGFTTMGTYEKNTSSENVLNRVKPVFADIDSQTMSNNKKAEPSFGFTTGNNKKISVSKNALKRAKCIFNDMNVDVDNNMKDSIISDDNVSFEIVHNKKNENKTVNRSNALETNENLNKMDILQNHTEISLNYSVPSLCVLSTKSFMNYEKWLPSPEEELQLKPSDRKIDENLSNYNNVSESEHKDTLHFPSSPILESKKMKFKSSFKVPYKTKNQSNQKLTIAESKTDEDRNFSQLMKYTKSLGSISVGNLLNDKQNRSLNLLTLKNLQEQISGKVFQTEKEISTLSPSNFHNFIFKNNRINVNANSHGDITISVEDIFRLFIEHKDIDRNIVPDGWVLNHIKWIMWKLASYERMYASILEGELVLTVTNVLKQLKYRYDRELCNSERPILRKLLENDDVSTKTMVLCVSNIKLNENNGKKNDRVQNAKYELELTDGWYEVSTMIDAFLSAMIDKKKITIGTKLIMSGAELLNESRGISPLEERGDVRLKIWANNCRRCASWVKLGLYKNCKKPLFFNLKTCRPGNGPIPALRIVPINIYPTLFLNKSSDGAIVMNSEKIQDVQNSKNEEKLQKEIEQLYDKVRKEFYNENISSKTNKIAMKKIKSNNLAEELINLYESSAEPVEFMNNLPESQRRIMEQYVIEKENKDRQEIDDRVRKLLNDLVSVRNQPVKVLKARIVSLDAGGFTSAILTIWKPTECMLDFFKEGIILDVTNLTPTGIRSNELHISAGKRSLFTEIHKPKNKINLYDFSSKCTEYEDMYLSNFIPKFNEVNLVGIVIDLVPNTLDESNEKSGKMQTLYLANEKQTFIAVNFWGGVKKYGFSKTIDKGVYLACSNLQYRARSLVKRTRQLYVTELSNFTQYPKSQYLSTALLKLKMNMNNVNLNDFIEKCANKLKSITNFVKTNDKNQTNAKNIIDELRDVASIDFDVSLSENGDEEYQNKTNSKLSFSRSSILGENTMNADQNSSMVELKINKLKLYGEPPPLAPIVIRNSLRVNKIFSIPSRCQNMSNTVENVSVTNKNSKMVIEEDDFSPPLSLE